MGTLYGSDLARIHFDGYGFHWEGASGAILNWLRDAGIRRGTVVDLGCGGGQWLERLAKLGYTPVGVDISPEMLRLAQSLVPAATLICGSFAEVDLPPCDVVTSLGEPLNYLDGPRSLRRTLKRVHRVLTPGGLFIFDVRVPATKSINPRVAARVGDDWACIAEIEETAKSNRLIRQITTFRRVGRVYHRDAERHELRLYPKLEILQWLRQLGFRVRTFRGYGKYLLGPRQVVIVARK